MKLIVFSVVLIAGIFWTRGEVNCPAEDPEQPKFFPHEVNCWQYYECAEGVPMLANCSDGLYWHEALNTCDYPSAVDCGKLSTTTSHAPRTTETVTDKSI